MNFWFVCDGVSWRGDCRGCQSCEDLHVRLWDARTLGTVKLAATLGGYVYFPVRYRSAVWRVWSGHRSASRLRVHMCAGVTTCSPSVIVAMAIVTGATGSHGCVARRHVPADVVQGLQRRWCGVSSTFLPRLTAVFPSCVCICEDAFAAPVPVVVAGVCTVLWRVRAVLDKSCVWL